MKKLKSKRQRKIAMLAIGILSVIAIIAVFVNPIATGIFSVSAFGLMVGSIELTPEQEKFYNAMMDDVRKEIDKQQKGYFSETKMSELITGHIEKFTSVFGESALIKELNKQIDEIKAAAIKQGEQISKFNNSIPTDQLPTLKEGLRQVLSKKLEGKSESDIERMVKSGELSFTIRKTAGTMEITTNVTGNDVGRVRVNPNWDVAPRRIPFVRDIIGFTSTNSPTDRVVEMSNEDGDATWTAEGSLKPLVDFDLKTTDYTSKEVSVRVDVTEKMLADVDRLMGEIEKKIMSVIDLREEDGILFGTGSGNDPVGITTIASAYTITGVATQNPNNFDAIVAAYTQLITLEHSPNACYVNPIDWANMKLRKGQDGQYVVNLPGQVIDGLPIFPKNKIPVGYFLIGDFTKATGLDYKTLEIKPGYINDNFGKAILTLRAIKEIIFYVTTNQHNAFIYDSFDVVKEDITEVND